eukprot:5271616-Amphidinium_carterae.1
MARYQTRRRPESALQRDDVIPTPLDNIQPEESAALQPAAATTSSSAAASSSDQPMEVGQPVSASGLARVAEVSTMHVPKTVTLVGDLGSSRSGYASLVDCIRMPRHSQLSRVPQAQRGSGVEEISDSAATAWIKLVLGVVFGAGSLRGSGPFESSRFRRVRAPTETRLAVVRPLYAQADAAHQEGKCVWNVTSGGAAETEEVLGRGGNLGTLRTPISRHFPVCSDARRGVGRLVDAAQKPGVHYAPWAMALPTDSGTVREKQCPSQGDSCSAGP